MLGSKTVLIIDDNAYCALDLAATVETRGGQVAGLASTAEEALALIATSPVDAAILDADVENAAAVAARLASARIPFVVQAGTRLGIGLRGLCEKTAVLFRPVDPKLVVSLLSVEIDKAGINRTEHIVHAPRQD